MTVNGTEPQNPLLPAHTNETGGGRIMTQLFAGLVHVARYCGLYEESVAADADGMARLMEAIARVMKPA